MSTDAGIRSRLAAAARDVLAGLVFVVIGLGFAAASTSYQIGTPLRMGPGFFPLVVGGLLAVLGLVVILKGVLAGESEPIGGVPWRAILLIIGAIVFFGLTVRGLGLVPSVLVVGLMSSFASERTRIVGGVAIAIALTVLSVLIFVVALQLRLTLFGPWIPL